MAPRRLSSVAQAKHHQSGSLPLSLSRSSFISSSSPSSPSSSSSSSFSSSSPSLSPSNPLPPPLSSFSSSASSTPSFSTLFIAFISISFILAGASIPTANAQNLPQLINSPSLLSNPLALDLFHLSQPQKTPASGPLGAVAVAPDHPLHKRAPQTVQPTATTTSDTKPSKTTKPTTTTTTTTTATTTSKSMSTVSSSIPSPTPTSAVDSKGDFALFGKPSVVGAFNLTSGILIYSAFLILFIGSVGSATWQRSRYRNQFRQQQRLMAAESGRVAPGMGNKKSSGDDELSDAALFKQASISKRALMKDVGPGGVMAANDAVKTKIATANGAGRSFDNRDQQVRFGEAQPNNTGTGRTGGIKKTPARSNSGNKGQDANQGGYEMNTYGQHEDPLQYYQDNHDTTDYSRPPLTESVDPYYSSGSSHSGYLDQAEESYYNDKSNSSPQMPRPAYNPRAPGNASTSPQAQYQQPVFVQRTNSSRMPQNELHDANNVYRSNSGRGSNGSPNIPSRSLERSGSNPSRIATQGLVERSGSGGQSRSNSPIDGSHHMSRNGSSASNSRARTSPTQTHPTPIARSNSTRLPPQMRGGTPQPGPSGLSQQTNNYDYM